MRCILSDISWELLFTSLTTTHIIQRAIIISLSYNWWVNMGDYDDRIFDIGRLDLSVIFTPKISTSHFIVQSFGT